MHVREVFLSQGTMPAPLKLPASICRWLDSWGPELCRDLQEALHSAAKLWPELGDSCPSRPSSTSFFNNVDLRVGTDCSGVESPLHALKALGVRFQHEFSSESAPAPRKVIAANTRPKIFMEDVHCQEKHLPHVDLYVSGFSCKPFSMLHWKTELLQEAEAEVFFSVLKRIQAKRPAAYVLENVEGISRCMDKILPLLEDVGYQVSVLSLNPTELGEPVNRPRIYFVGVRSDVAKLSKEPSQLFYKHIWSHLTQKRLHRNKCEFGSSLVPLWCRLLPDDSDLVAAKRQERMQKWEDAKQLGFPDKLGKTKWRQRHQTWSAGKELKAVAEGNLQWAELSPDKLHLHLPRERDAWWSLIQTFDEPCKVVADLSQNLDRMPCRTDGSLPTITPGAHIMLGCAGRALLPVEKLLLHALPLHRMILPDGISDSELESMGGNMMHLQTVAVAMAVALSLVDWAHPHALLPTAVPAAPAALATKLRNSKTRRPRKSTAEKMLEMKLKARFGFHQRKGGTKVSKARKAVDVKAKSCRGPACLRGTRWHS